MRKPGLAVGHAGVYSPVKSIEECESEDVYCISVPSTGNFVANGIVVKNCDALRYALTPFLKSADFGSPDEQLTIDQLKRKIYDEDGYGFMNPGMGGGYF
jgi:hypothetical protein